MTQAELTTMVESIDAGILSVVTTGQSFIVDGIQYSAANLNALRDLRSYYSKILARLSGRRPLMNRMNATQAAY